MLPLSHSDAILIVVYWTNCALIHVVNLCGADKIACFSAVRFKLYINRDDIAGFYMYSVLGEEEKKAQFVSSALEREWCAPTQLTCRTAIRLRSLSK